MKEWSEDGAKRIENHIGNRDCLCIGVELVARVAIVLESSRGRRVAAEFFDGKTGRGDTSIRDGPVGTYNTGSRRSIG